MAEDIALAIFGFLLAVIVYFSTWQLREDRRRSEEVMKRFKGMNTTGYDSKEGA